jgi:hypothetical protein
LLGRLGIKEKDILHYGPPNNFVDSLDQPLPQLERSITNQEKCLHRMGLLQLGS